jgi:uncharacterized protein
MSNLHSHLVKRHRKLDDMLRAEMRHAFVNPMEIARLKKLRLAIKDRLAALTRRRSAVVTA